MNHPLLCLLLLVVATPARADTPPPSGALTYRFADSVHRHSTMGFSTSRWHFADVSLQRLEGDAVRVVDEGESGEGNLDRTWGYREEAQTWRETWSGTWTPRGEDAAVLSLRRVDRSCTATEKGDRVPESATPCPARGRKRRLRLTCERVRLPLPTDYLSPATERPLRDVWRCLPDAGGPRSLTPTPWVFSETLCVEAVGLPPGKLGYRICAEPHRPRRSTPPSAPAATP